MDELKEQAATLAQDPVRFSLDIFPQNWWEKGLQRVGFKPKKKTYEVRPITYGNLQRISGLLLSINVNPSAPGLETAYRLMNEHAGTAAKVVALAIHNKKSLPPKGLEEELLFQLTTQEAMTLLTIVFKQMQVSGFLQTMVSIRGLNVFETAKKSEEKDESGQQTTTGPQVPGSLSVAS